MNLFEVGPFTLPSGLTTYFKIECDVLTGWEALARLAAEMLPPFSQVEGVPRGGVAFAEALEPYRSSEGGLLIADDVWVTGLSMHRHRQARPAFGVVAFARNPVADWVTSLFQMNPLAEKATYHLENS
jgi:hypothetical protein